MLVEEGKMKWDDPVRKYIDYFRLSDPLADVHVTIRDLVTHRTGFSRHDQLWCYNDLTSEEIIRRMAHAKPNTSFRSTYEYNNIMYLAAGVSAGIANGTSWDELVQTRIFDALGMSTANCSVGELLKTDNHALPYQKYHDGKIDLVPWCYIDNCAPGGGINASVRDLSRWLLFQVNKGLIDDTRLLSEELLLETRSPQIVVPRDANAKELGLYTHFPTYGLGWACYDYRGHPIQAHGGYLDGFRSHIALVPELNLGLAILSNLTPTSMPEALRNTLLDVALELSPDDWNGLFIMKHEEAIAEAKAKEADRDAKRHLITEWSLSLDDYVGTYVSEVFGDAEVTIEDDTLCLSWSHIHEPLSHFHFDTFKLEKHWPRLNELLQFQLDAKAEVIGISFMEMEFKRIKS